jgi:hypothetical protein
MNLVHLCVNRAPVVFIPNNKQCFLSGTQRSPYHDCRELWYQTGRSSPAFRVTQTVPRFPPAVTEHSSIKTTKRHCPTVQLRRSMHQTNRVCWAFFVRKGFSPALRLPKFPFQRQHEVSECTWCSSVPLSHQPTTSALYGVLCY